MLLLRFSACLSLYFFPVIVGVQLLAADGKRPNVVVILTDDQGYGDLSLHGNQQLKTPHLDSLATSAAQLQHFYVCSVCAPTRAEFLTGRYHARTGVRGVSTGLERLNLDEITVAQVLQQAGYATGAFGKWHNGSQWPYHPNARGFQEYYGFTSGHWGEYFDPPLEHNGKPVRGQGFIADDLTNHAIQFIEQQRTQPFFCYLALNTPHSPFAVPDAYWQRHRQQQLTQLAGDQDHDQTRCVLAMCENIDDNVGRLLAKLTELKLDDDTIVIYFTDNGPNTARFNAGMKGRKGSVDEGGLRVPCFVRWPARIKPGTVVEPIAGAIDLLPTLCALTGTPLPSKHPLDGVDLTPLLTGKNSNAWPARKIYSMQNQLTSLRTEQYRWVHRGGLFDLIADPGQQHDLTKTEPKLAAEFEAAALAWRREVLAVATDTRPYPVGYRVFPNTQLPARDGHAHGQVQRSSSAPNCSYFVNWTKTTDKLTWDIEVETTGEYVVTIDYTCPLADVGSQLELTFGQEKLLGRVTTGWDPMLYTNQDTIPRPKGESKMKEFHALELGTIKLNKGRGELTLRALEIPGKTVLDLRRISLLLK